MIIETPPKTTLVTDHTFRFHGGDAITVTLADGDVVTPTADGNFVLTARSADQTTIEVTEFYATHLVAHTTRVREVLVYAPGQNPLELAIKAESDRHPARHPVKELKSHG